MRSAVRSIWRFLSEPKNLAVLSLLGASLAFVWKIVEPRFFPEPSDQATVAAAPKAPSQTAIASGNGIAANAGPGAVINDGAGIRPASLAGSSGRQEQVADQRAEARDGGKALNAGPHAKITVNR